MAEVFFYRLIVAIPTAIIGGLLLTNSKMVKTKPIVQTEQNNISVLKIDKPLMSSSFAIILNVITCNFNYNSYYSIKHKKIYHLV